ncbi:MAG TPA: penicillin acylase family protein [Chitinophagaceae bacterium]
MRWIPLLVTSLITILLIYALNRSWGDTPAIGKLLSPQHGLWQNAEPADEAFNLEIQSSLIKSKAEVYLDERLVPHIFAQNETDAFFVQGYLHAKFRLWQMDFQTRAAAGRLSEILGPGANDVLINFDRGMRRLGMVYAAKIAVEESAKDPKTSNAIEAYAAGVNHYLDNTNKSQWPIEYKLLGYEPERWSALKTALFLKYMSLDLAGAEDDFELTNAKSIFSQQDLDLIYPITQDSLDPIVPKGTIFEAAGLKLTVPKAADSLYYGRKDSVSILHSKPDRDNGSNNWAVSGSKTASGRPILCNDPHLSLNLPSLWYEMQIHTPEFNAYGATFPGAPCIIIGFNDSCAWGFTNGMRDVRDYYEIEFKDKTRDLYKFNDGWKQTEWTVEKLKVKGRPDLTDSVAYTLFGPVMYDPTFTENGHTPNEKNYAVKWKAHEPSNELKIFYELNHTKNYEDYYRALTNLQTPGQNCVFASKSGDIAIWAQGSWPAKWYRQGDFVMPGTDSTYLWQGNIPQTENPHQINPERGFVSSANQFPTDITYPYYLGGSYPPYRGYIINRFLGQMSNITPEDMQRLQVENYNVFAEMAKPVLLKNIDESALETDEKEFLNIFKGWNLRNDPGERGITVFANWFDSLESSVWRDEIYQTDLPMKWPDESTLLEAMLRDSSFKFIDNIQTPEKETLPQLVTLSFKKAVPTLKKLKEAGRLEWAKFKGTGVRHLLRLGPLSRYNLPVGGGTHIINATKDFHGPSWRMIVHLTNETEAYAIYPGGQSGNPGSKYYDTFVDNWSAGKYYKLWFMKPEEKTDRRIVGKMVFEKG